jgi:hypothetical protein
VASLSVSTGTDIVGKTTSLVCRQEFKCLRCANLNQSLFGIPPYAAGQRWVVVCYRAVGYRIRMIDPLSLCLVVAVKVPPI